MTKDLAEITTIIREMILEIGELKERMNALEQTLRQAPVVAEKLPEHAAEPALTEEEKIRLQGESFENLGRLYTSGYHICQVFFGERHDGECLFCVALLEKR